VPIESDGRRNMDRGHSGWFYLGLNVDTGELMAVKQMAIDEVSINDWAL
jgi:hypothetical protein